MTRGITKGVHLKKAGTGSTHGNDNILVKVNVPKTGKYLVSYRVVIVPLSIEYWSGTSSNWYDTHASKQKNLKTYLYKGTGHYNDTEVYTNGRVFAKIAHHIFWQKVIDLTKGDEFNIKSWCNPAFGDDYTLLHFNAYDAEITMLSL